MREDTSSDVRPLDETQVPKQLNLPNPILHLQKQGSDPSQSSSHAASYTLEI